MPENSGAEKEDGQLDTQTYILAFKVSILTLWPENTAFLIRHCTRITTRLHALGISSKSALPASPLCSSLACRGGHEILCQSVPDVIANGGPIRSSTNSCSNLRSYVEECCGKRRQIPSLALPFSCFPDQKSASGKIHNATNPESQRLGDQVISSHHYRDHELW